MLASRASVNQRRIWDSPWPILRVTGQFEISMEEGRDGEVSIGTVTSQLVYEIQGPLYFNSSVVARLEGLQLQQVGRNRVRVTGVQGLPPPPTTKVGITAAGGLLQNITSISAGWTSKRKSNGSEHKPSPQWGRRITRSSPCYSLPSPVSPRTIQNPEIAPPSMSGYSRRRSTTNS